MGIKFADRLAGIFFLQSLINTFGVAEISRVSGYQPWEIEKYRIGVRLTHRILADMYDTAVILSGHRPDKLVLDR